MKNTVKRVEETSQIEIEFKLCFLDGTLIEGTEEGEVFALQIGDGQILNKLDELLIGLEEGTRAKFNLMPEQAFGKPDPNNFQEIPRAEFSKELELEVGYVIGFNTPTGDEIPGTVFKIAEDVITIDFNHPLVDKPIVFEAKIITILS